MLIYMNLHKRLPEESVICEICAKEVKKMHYRSHMSTVHGKEGPKMKKCEHCGDMVKANSYNSHKNKHLKNARHYLCADCGSSFNNPEVCCIGRQVSFVSLDSKSTKITTVATLLVC